jgi:hypothetical protein
MIREARAAGSGAQPQVFISYGRADAEKVLKFARLLEAKGVTVWRDGDRILGGQYYGEEIVHAIAHSRVVMLMCSPHSLQSDNVHKEVLLTWEYAHRHYVPVWLAPAMVIPERFRWCLVGCQWIECCGWRTSASGASLPSRSWSARARRCRWRRTWRRC